MAWSLLLHSTELVHGNIKLFDVLLGKACSAKGTSDVVYYTTLCVCVHILYLAFSPSWVLIIVLVISQLPAFVLPRCGFSFDF